MSKHGDSAKTRANKRSPWDVVHPGRQWALDPDLEDSMSPDEIKAKIDQVLAATPPHDSHAALLEKMLEGFAQAAVAEEPKVTPLGEDAPGPDPDEAGGEDDE